MSLTNLEFASKLGITDSYASYLRNGQRLPSGEILVKIIMKFEMSPEQTRDAHLAYLEGGSAFGAFLRREVFGEKGTPVHSASTPGEPGQS